jgi:hypothetical protein
MLRTAYGYETVWPSRWQQIVGILLRYAANDMIRIHYSTIMMLHLMLLYYVDMPNLPCARSTGKGSTLGPLTKRRRVGTGPEFNLNR